MEPLVQLSTQYYANDELEEQQRLGFLQNQIFNYMESLNQRMNGIQEKLDMFRSLLCPNVTVRIKSMETLFYTERDFPSVALELVDTNTGQRVTLPEPKPVGVTLFNSLGERLGDEVLTFTIPMPRITASCEVLGLRFRKVSARFHGPFTLLFSIPITPTFVANVTSPPITILCHRVKPQHAARANPTAQASVSCLGGVGPKLLSRFKELGFVTVQDLAALPDSSDTSPQAKARIDEVFAGLKKKKSAFSHEKLYQIIENAKIVVSGGVPKMILTTEESAEPQASVTNTTNNTQHGEPLSPTDQPAISESDPPTPTPTTTSTDHPVANTPSHCNSPDFDAWDITKWCTPTPEFNDAISQVSDFDALKDVLDDDLLLQLLPPAELSCCGKRSYDDTLCDSSLQFLNDDIISGDEGLGADAELFERPAKVPKLVRGATATSMSSTAATVAATTTTTIMEPPQAHKESTATATQLSAALLSSPFPMHLSILAKSPLVSKFVFAHACSTKKYHLLQQPNSFGFTPLMLACTVGRADVVQMLLSLGNKVDLGSSGTWAVSPLDLALLRNDTECSKLLIAKNATRGEQCSGGVAVV